MPRRIPQSGKLLKTFFASIGLSARREAKIDRSCAKIVSQEA
jgi:hypothetical protein